MATVGRNDLCPCGSGKKYKKCCLNWTVASYTQQDIFLFALELKGLLDLCAFYEEQDKLDELALQGFKVPPKDLRDSHANRIFSEAPAEFIDWVPLHLKPLYLAELKKDLDELYFICCDLIGKH